MHDGIDPRLGEVRGLHGYVVAEEALAAGIAGGDGGVQLAARQHLREALVGHRVHAHAGRQRELHFFDAARLVHACLQPGDRGEVHAVLVLQKAARVDPRGLRPFRNPDPLAFQILGAAQGRSHVDRRVAEDPRRKHREGDDVGVRPRQQRQRLGEGHLGRVPFAKAREAVENLLDRQVLHGEVDALRVEIPHVVVRADGEGERNAHRV